MPLNFRREEATDANTEDGSNFMQEGSLQIMVGYDNLIYGAKIETSGGADGILPNDNRLRAASKL